MSYILYRNFEDFKDAHPKLAEELLIEVSEGTWQKEELIWYNTLADYAQYELEEGVYSSCGLFEQSFHGYPNPMDFIDLNALGDDISDDWDERCYHRFSDDSVISTSYGW